MDGCSFGDGDDRVAVLTSYDDLALLFVEGQNFRIGDNGGVGDGLQSAEKDGYDAVKAALPAGTLSGAPKIRAMEIIDELEKTRRGPYGGACGYFGFNGNLDTCITIRTVLIKDGRAYVQALSPRRDTARTAGRARRS